MRRNLREYVQNGLPYNQSQFRHVSLNVIIIVNNI